MKLRDVYGKASGIKQDSKHKTMAMPIPTVQKQINQKPPLASKFLKKVGKRFKAKVGRAPADAKERYQMPIPPRMGGRVEK